MSTTRHAATALVRISTLVLPRGRARDRCRQELLAELHGLAPSQQLRLALGVAGHVLALRRALTEEGQQHPDLGVSRTPWHCQLHLWHHHRTTMTDDGELYVACIDCGHVKDNYLYPVTPSMSSRGLPM